MDATVKGGLTCREEAVTQPRIAGKGRVNRGLRRVSGEVGGVYQDSQLCDSEQRKSAEQKRQRPRRKEERWMRSGD
jgi:hypothetical protein